MHSTAVLECIFRLISIPSTNPYLSIDIIFSSPLQYFQKVNIIRMHTSTLKGSLDGLNL